MVGDCGTGDDGDVGVGDGGDDGHLQDAVYGIVALWHSMLQLVENPSKVLAAERRCFKMNPCTP